MVRSLRLDRGRGALFLSADAQRRDDGAVAAGVRERTAISANAATATSALMRSDPRTGEIATKMDHGRTMRTVAIAMPIAHPARGDRPAHAMTQGTTRSSCSYERAYGAATTPNAIHSAAETGDRTSARMAMTAAIPIPMTAAGTPTADGSVARLGSPV